MTRDEIIRQTINDHYHTIINKNHKEDLFIYIRTLPCIECLVQPMCINRIKLEAAKENDPTFKEDVNEGQNVDEWMDWAIARILEDKCIILHEYLHYVVKSADAGMRGEPVSEVIRGYFGERVGMWYYQPKL